MGEARRKAEQLEKVGIRLPEGFTSLLISTPSYSGFSNVYVHAMTPTVSMLTQLGIPKAILTLPGEAEVYRARNNLMAYFMASEHSHMLCIDSDVHWKAEDVLRLLISGHEIVMGTYPRKKLPEPGQPMSYPIHWKLPTADGKFETCPTCGSVAIEGGPAGFMMIRRSVGEKMSAAYPDLKYDGEGSVADVSDHLYGFYNPMIEGRTMWSEDLSFCRRWRSIGGDVWLDPAIELDHQGTYIFKGSVKELIVQVPRDAAEKSGAA